jgi:hypothetical protein
VEIDRDSERFCPLQDWPEKGVVQVASPGVPVDQRPLEAILTDRALQLLCGGLRGGRRQRGEPGEAIRIAPHRLREEVVRLTSERYRLCCLKLLNARKGQRQHLHIDACGVHRRDPAAAEIAQLFDELFVARRNLGMAAGRFRLSLQLPPRAFHERLGGVVLL